MSRCPVLACGGAVRARHVALDSGAILWYTGGAGQPGTIPFLIGRKGVDMAESVYKVIELVGTSPESWEKAAAAAVEMASKTLHDLRIAEVVTLDIQIEDQKVYLYRAKVRLSFKYHGGE
jgi:dodecin